MFYSYTLQISVKIKMGLWNRKEKARQILYVKSKENGRGKAMQMDKAEIIAELQIYQFMKEKHKGVK